MYSSKYFTEEHIMAYECQSNDKKDNWHKNLKYFANLYALQKAYSEDRAGKRGFKSAVSVKKATTRPWTMYFGRIAITTGANTVITTSDTTEEYNEYVEGLEQSLAEVKEYAANIQTTTTTDAAVEALKAKLLAQRKKNAGILAQNSKMMEAMMKVGAVAGAGTTVQDSCGR